MKTERGMSNTCLALCAADPTPPTHSPKGHLAQTVQAHSEIY
jgi:hypothetical protein